MARLFLSYRTLDSATARRWHDQLAADGHDVFMAELPEDGIPIGDEWEPRLYDELHRADAVVALVTAGYLESHWCFAELAITRARGVPVFPVSLQSGLEHPILRAVQHLDGARDPASALDRLRTRLRSLDGPGGRVWNEDRPAYRGLEPFDTNDAAIFFGRQTDIDNLTTAVCTPVARLQRRPLLMIGASGSGKSSVVRAGLVPAVARREGWLVIPTMFPGDAPTTALAFQIARAMTHAGASVDGTQIREQVRKDIGDLLMNVAIAAGNATSILLVVDQIEELVSRVDREAAQEFLAILERAAATSTPDVRVVGTLRSDALSKLLELWAKPSPFASHLLAPLGRAALTEVIEGPARVAGLHVPPALTATLVEDTGEGNALPFLSFVLLELATGQRRGGTLTLQRYQELGGVQQALIRQADAALADAVGTDGMTRDDILHTLTELVSIDDAGNLVRRRRAHTSLDERAQRALDPFVVRRLLTVKAEGDETVIDVAHESFIRAWPPLEETIRGLTAELELGRDVERAALAWRRVGRDDSYLWDTKGASNAALLTTLSSEAKAFVARSLEVAHARAANQADAIGSQLLLADLPRREPETALAVAVAVASEIALTPRIVGCLHDALAWHEVESLLTEFTVFGVRLIAGYLTADQEVVTVSAGVGSEPPSTALRPEPLVGQPPNPNPPSRLFVDAWNLPDQSPRWRVSIDGSEVHQIVSDGGRLAVSTDAGMCIIDVRTGDVVKTWAGSGPVLVALSGDGTHAAISSGDALIIRDYQSGNDVTVAVSAPAAPLVMNARFSDDGGRFAYRDRQGVVQELVVASGLPIVRGDDEPEIDLRWPRDVSGSLPRAYRDRLHVVSGDRALVWHHWYEHQVSVWNLRRPRAVTSVRRIDSPEAGSSAPVSERDAPGPRTVAISFVTRRTLEGPPWRITTPESAIQLPTDYHRPAAAAFSANGRWLISCAPTFVEVRDAETGETTSKFGVYGAEDSDPYCAVAISDDGCWAVTGSRLGGRSMLWGVQAGTTVGDIGGTVVAIDPAGRFVIAGSFENVWVVPVATPGQKVQLEASLRPIRTPPVMSPRDGGISRDFASLAREWPIALAVSEDGTLAAIATDRWALVCTLPAGEPLFAWSVKRAQVQFAGAELLMVEDQATFAVAIPAPEDMLRMAVARVRDRVSAEDRVRFGLPSI